MTSTSYLNAPQLDRPVKGGGEEVGWEVDLSRHAVCVNGGDGTLVAFICLVDASFAVGQKWHHMYDCSSMCAHMHIHIKSEDTENTHTNLYGMQCKQSKTMWHTQISHANKQIITNNSYTALFSNTCVKTHCAVQTPWPKPHLHTFQQTWLFTPYIHTNTHTIHWHSNTWAA